MQWKRPQTGRCTYWERPFTRLFGDDWIPKLKRCKTWTEWLSLTEDVECAWHSMLNLKYTSDLAKGADTFAINEKRPRDDSNPWNVARSSDSHRRLEILGDSKVVIHWMNGDWEVKGNEHTTHVRDVIDQFVRWYLCGTFRPRNDEGCWCRHVFRESNKAADTHTNWLMDNGDSGLGAQWKRRDYTEKLKSAKHVVLSFDGARRGSGNGAAAWILWIRNIYGEFERISHGGKVLKDTTAMTAEREALRMGVEHLMTLFPVEAKDFQFVVENESREKSTKLIRSPCVSSAFATIMRRTCIVLMRIVLGKMSQNMLSMKNGPKRRMSISLRSGLGRPGSRSCVLDFLDGIKLVQWKNPV